MVGLDVYDYVDYLVCDDGKRALMIGKPRRIVAKASKRLKVARSRRIPASLLKKVDDAYSLKIRARDSHCQFPGCMATKTQNSHYIGRANKSTRFDDDNCDALCYFHHFASKDLGFEYQKQTKAKHGFDGQYTKFKRRQLGSERFNALLRRSKIKTKLTREKLELLIKLLTT